MRNLIPALVLAMVLACLPPSGLAQSGLSLGPGSGIGLKSPLHAYAPSLDLAFGNEATAMWQSTRGSDYTLYGGTRSAPQLGLRASESYGGVVHSLPGGWGSSLEAAYRNESVLSPRRYALTGQLHGALGEGRAWSVGLQYRLNDASTPAWQPVTAGDPFTPNNYTLAPSRLNGTGLVPSYQVQMSYQYSAAATFGLALGREVEAFVPALDPGASGPRQLTFTGQHWVTPSWALSYDVLSQDAVQPLRSMGLRLGVRYRW